MERSSSAGGKVAETQDPATGPLYTLSYASTATSKFGTADLLDLLKQARRANSQHGITGLLLHRDGTFLQVLEGPKSEVLTLYERIRQDERHADVETLVEEGLTAREFTDWQMAFAELDGVDVSLLPGFSSFLADPEDPRDMLETLGRGKRLARLFRALA